MLQISLNKSSDLPQRKILFWSKTTLSFSAREALLWQWYKGSHQKRLEVGEPHKNNESMFLMMVWRTSWILQYPKRPSLPKRVGCLLLLQRDKISTLLQLIASKQGLCPDLSTLRLSARVENELTLLQRCQEPLWAVVKRVNSTWGTLDRVSHKNSERLCRRVVRGARAITNSLTSDFSKSRITWNAWCILRENL